MEHLIINKLITDEQFSFLHLARSSFKCSYLLFALNQWNKLLQSGKSVVIANFDFNKATYSHSPTIA